MGTWDTEIDFNFRGWLVLSAFAATIAIAWVVLLGTRAREEPNRCAPGFSAAGPRCCAPGQAVSAGHCVGKPSSCPDPFELKQLEGDAGCVLSQEPVSIPGGSVTLGPTDWDSADVVQRHIVSVRPFLIDRSEVTQFAYSECISAGLCLPRELSSEPGAPMTHLSAEEAQAFCKFAGGRLPTAAEWLFAASGKDSSTQGGRRYPWGAHGLVCRRASFGLTKGPCASDGIAPELAGMRPDGRSPEGIYDLAGNVAEWSREEDGSTRLHGGSFHSKVAGELKVWATEKPRVADDVGFRCVYPDDPARVLRQPTDLVP